MTSSDMEAKENSMQGRKVMVTAGPTIEPIDAVRFITNRSSGRMGYALAEYCAKVGAEVYLITGPTHIPIPSGMEKVYKIDSALEMLQVAQSIWPKMHWGFFAAAVADYRMENPSKTKIKKEEDRLTLELIKNPDVLKLMAAQKTSTQTVVGFALEAEDIPERAIKKLQSKNCDYIVFNTLAHAGAGFDVATNVATVFSSNGAQKYFGLMSKQQLAQELVSYLLQSQA